MGRKNIQSVLVVFLIFLIFLIISFISTFLFCNNQSKILRTYSYSKEHLEVAHEDVFITVTISKHWDDSDLKQEKPMGAQYNGIITNFSENTFNDWVVKLNFSEDLIIDSSWNGEFLVNGNQVTFIAKDNPAHVKPNCVETFGAIMYADSLMSLESYELQGYKELLMKDLPFFWILIALFIIWSLILIIYSILYYKTNIYVRKLELDSKIILQSMSTLISFIDAKDAYTRHHSTRVAIYSSEIGRLLNMNENEVENLYYIALMHDCGKIGVPDKLLNSSLKLNDDEFKEIQSHTEKGKSLLRNFTAIPNISDGAYYHHERFDGKGYPEGLKDIDIPLCARIICVADSYDAMSSDRCYRKALNRENILDDLISNSGSQFDPEIVRIMITLIENGYVEKIKEEYPLI